MRILGLDIGEKRIGVAVSDELGITAQPLPTIDGTDTGAAVREIASLVEKYKASEVVAGLPLNMDGSHSARTRSTCAFIENMQGSLSVPVKTWDERLSSLQADRMMLHAGVRRNKRRAASDRLAAQLILQSYLEAKGSNA